MRPVLGRSGCRAGPKFTEGGGGEAGLHAGNKHGGGSRCD
jgi:hypothetical protein